MGFDLGSIVGSNIGAAAKDALEGLGTFAKNVREAITGQSILDPNKQAELLAQAQQLDGDLQKGQADIAKIEAASPKLFIAGPRPFLMWICGISIGCYFIPLGLMSAIIWIKSCIVAGWVMKPFVSPFDVGQLIALVLAMTGAASLRTIEKIKGVAGDHN